MVDELLARTLRCGDTVIYRDALHTVIAVQARGAPDVVLHGPYATGSAVSHTLLHFPVLLNPPTEEAVDG